MPRGSMITLYQFPARWDVCSASCFCAKLEAFLRWCKLHYTKVDGLSLKDAPKGKVPYVDIGGVKTGDSELVIEMLCRTHQLEAYPGLNDEQKAQARAIRYLCEEGIYRAMAYFRFADEAGWQVIRRDFFGDIPAWAGPLLRHKVQRLAVKQLQAQGMGRHSPKEVAEIGMRDVSALAAMLGDRPYFFGGQMTLADITVFSVMSNLLVPPFENPLVRHARAQANLVAHCQRVREACFGTALPKAA